MEVAARYYPRRVAVRSLGGGYSWISVRGADELIPIDPRVAEVFAACRGVHTLAGHVERLIARGLHADRGALMQLMEAFVQAGFLKRYAEATGRDSARRASGSSEVCVGVITADRPAKLATCLASIVRQVQRHRFESRIVVVDASQCSTHQERNAQLVGDIAVAAPVRTEYWGPHEAERLRRALREVIEEESVLEWALTPREVGACRNLLLLLTAGHRLVMVDDDMLYEPWTHDGVERELVSLRHSDCYLSEYFDTRAEAISSVTPSAADLLALQTSSLGQTLGSVLANANGVDVSEACPELLEWIEEPESCTIRASAVGIAGDSGMSCPDPLLFCSGAMRAKLLSDEATFQRALRSREMWRVAPAALVTHEPIVMAGGMAIGNDYVAGGPFMPCGRNEDGVYGRLLEVLEPRNVYMHVPAGIVHDSARASGYSARMVTARISGFADIVLAILEDCGRRGRSGLAAAEVGAIMESYGRMPAREFLDCIHEAIIERRARELRYASTAEGRSELPDYWTATVDEYRQSMAAHAGACKFVLPIELADAAVEGQEHVTATQRQVLSFAQLLTVWPRLWEAAREKRLPRCEVVAPS